MRIVITTTLNNNLFHAKLVPLLRSRPDVELIIVTDRQGPQYERVKWVYPTGRLTLFGRLPSRIYLLFKEVFRKNTQLIMAYSLVPHGLFAVTMAKIRRRPVFLHFIAGPAELRFAHDKRVTDNRLIAKTQFPGLWEKLAARFAHAADRIFVPGAITARQLEQDGIPPAKISILHSTVDPERFHPPEPDIERDIDIVVCARFIERKRPDFTLDIFKELVERRPDIRLYWLGNAVMQDAFREKVQSRGLEKNLVWMETDEVTQYFIRSKVFLLCSLNEGLSLGSLEAMACGVVPVVARCGDMEYAIHNQRNGVVMEQSATIADYIEAVSSVLDNRDLWENYSRAALQEIKDNHSFEAAQHKWREQLEALENR